MNKDFVGIYENVYSPEYCKLVIDTFNLRDKYGYASSRMVAEGVDQVYKADKSTFLPEHVLQEMPLGSAHPEVQIDFNQIFWNTCYPKYADEYSILKTHEHHGIYDIKIQRTQPGEGYHVWHCENDSRINGSRIAMVIGYLNDVDEGGETEFLYQHKRIKPEKGTIIICPSSFTHTHRGNPPLSNTKYIINGWIEYY